MTGDGGDRGEGGEGYASVCGTSLEGIMDYSQPQRDH